MTLQSSPTAVIVTGGAQGIGFACAEAMAQSGRPVALWDINETAAGKSATLIQESFGVTAMALGIDTSDTEGFNSAVNRTIESLGPIGGLVHAAGITQEATLSDLTEESWDKIQAVNLRSYPFLVKALLEEFSKNSGSAIVGIASINAVLGNGNTPAYSVSKAGIMSLTKSLAQTLGGDGIRINAVAPGYIDTPMSEKAFERFPELKSRLVSRTFLRRMGRPTEIATTVRFLLSDEASYITGQTLLIDGGATLFQI